MKINPLSDTLHSFAFFRIPDDLTKSKNPVILNAVILFYDIHKCINKPNTGKDDDKKGEQSTETVRYIHTLQLYYSEI
jgi:hypothetical protein